MKTLTITTTTDANANFLAAFLKTVKIVKSVVINKRTIPRLRDSEVSEPEEEYNWTNPSRPATDEEFEQMISECEVEYEAGLGMTVKEAKALTEKKISKWRKKNQK